MKNFILLCILFATLANATVIPLIAEIKNEQPYSLDNNAIRIRIFNTSTDTLKEISFCYRFHAKQEFVFEDNWYLPDLNYKVDTLTDTTYQIHFWLKQGASIAPNNYFPNTSGIVFGLHYKNWYAWEHQKDYSFSASTEFEPTEKLFLSMTNECKDYVSEIDTARIKILGYDRDGNGVRDDLDSLIDAKIPDNPEQRAAYRYFAQAKQNQWKAFYENPNMTYEELFPYEVLTALSATLLQETNAESNLKWNVYQAQVHNTIDRILFERKIDRKFAGKFLPVAVETDKRYSNLVEEGMSIYNKILEQEKAKQ
jgi:hypothetical protein